MKKLVIIFLYLFFSIPVFSQYSYQEIIQLSWGKNDAEIGFRKAPGGQFGPMSFSVENDTIYIPKSDFFYVLGEVSNPGQYKLEKDITVLKAISRAGGHTKKANLKKITIIRVAGGREKEHHALLSDPVLPDDIIKIPESFF